MAELQTILQHWQANGNAGTINFHSIRSPLKIVSLLVCDRMLAASLTGATFIAIRGRDSQ
jgi:hypothetical protein